MKWSPEEEQCLSELAQRIPVEYEEKPFTWLAAQLKKHDFPRSRSTVRSKILHSGLALGFVEDTTNPLEATRMDAGGQNKANTPKITFKDKKRGKVDWRRSLADAETNSKRHYDMSSSQNSASILINTDHPIAVCFSSDWHLGSVAVDYKSLQEHVDYILKTKDLFLVTAGDSKDNMILFRGNVATNYQIFSPKEQQILIKEIFRDFWRAGKLLCTGFGNHDVIWEEKALGYSPTAMIKGEYGVYFRGMGLLKLQIGSQKKYTEYQIVMSHRGKGSSQYNQLHGAIKQALMYCPEADVSVSAHIHNPAFGHWYGHGLDEAKPELTFPSKERIYVVCGSFKTSDPYAQRYFGQARIGCPTIVFFPHEKLMVPFQSPELAVDFLKSQKSRGK